MASLHIVIQSTSAEEHYLPVAHTCYNLLDMPCYRTKETLRHRLTQAVEQYEGFSLVWSLCPPPSFPSPDSQEERFPRSTSRQFDGGGLFQVGKGPSFSATARILHFNQRRQGREGRAAVGGPEVWGSVDEMDSVSNSSLWLSTYGEYWWKVIYFWYFLQALIYLWLRCKYLLIQQFFCVLYWIKNLFYFFLPVGVCHYRQRNRTIYLTTRSSSDSLYTW